MKALQRAICQHGINNVTVMFPCSRKDPIRNTGSIHTVECKVVEDPWHPITEGYIHMIFLQPLNEEYERVHTYLSDIESILLTQDVECIKVSCDEAPKKNFVYTIVDFNVEDGECHSSVLVFLDRKVVLQKLLVLRKREKRVVEEGTHFSYVLLINGLDRRFANTANERSIILEFNSISAELHRPDS
jgi:hypothetical protein